MKSLLSSIKRTLLRSRMKSLQAELEDLDYYEHLLDARRQRISQAIGRTRARILNLDDAPLGFAPF